MNTINHSSFQKKKLIMEREKKKKKEKERERRENFCLVALCEG
jgi:hypothetical protein